MLIYHKSHWKQGNSPKCSKANTGCTCYAVLKITYNKIYVQHSWGRQSEILFCKRGHLLGLTTNTAVWFWSLRKTNQKGENSRGFRGRQRFLTGFTWRGSAFQMQMLFSFLGKQTWWLNGCTIERETCVNQDSLWRFPLGAPEYYHT